MRFTADELLSIALREKCGWYLPAVQDAQRELGEGSLSWTREQWLEAGSKIGWNESLEHVLDIAARKRKEKMSITENDLRRALDGMDGIAGIRLNQKPAVVAEQVLQYLRDNPESFIPLGVYKDSSGDFYRRTEEDDGWQEFGSSIVLSDSVPLRPLRLQ